MSIHQQFMPETDPEQLHPFRVEGKVAIQSLLRELITRRALIALYGAQDLDEFVVSQVLDFDDRHVQLDFVTDTARRDVIMSAPKIIVIGFLDTIKIQFEVAGLSTVDTPKGPVLRCPLPTRLHRLQRRDAFRVRPLVTDPVVCFVRTGLDREQAFKVIDFSALGVAFGLPPGIDMPKARELLRHCRLEFSGSKRVIPCDLLVRNIAGGTSVQDPGRRIGCEFHHLTPEASREIQLAVMDVEKKARAARG